MFRRLQRLGKIFSGPAFFSGGREGVPCATEGKGREMDQFSIPNMLQKVGFCHESGEPSCSPARFRDGDIFGSPTRFCVLFHHR